MSPHDYTDVFQAEFEKLTELIEDARMQELSINDIVGVYHQIITVSSMITVLKQTVQSGGILPKEILKAERKISEFNSEVHPKILTSLTASIEEVTRNLQTRTSKQAQNAENMAVQYDKLRQKMSTREFVEQYDSGLGT